MVSAASEESRERNGRFGNGRMSRSGKMGDGVSGAEVYAPPVRTFINRQLIHNDGYIYIYQPL